MKKKPIEKRVSTIASRLNPRTVAMLHWRRGITGQRFIWEVIDDIVAEQPWYTDALRYLDLKEAAGSERQSKRNKSRD